MADIRKLQEMDAVVNASKQNLRQPQQNGGIGGVLSALAKPALDYGKFVGEAISQAGRTFTDPAFYKAQFNPEAMTEAERQKVLNAPTTFFERPEDIAPENLALTTLKRTAGGASYVPIPGVGNIANATIGGALSSFSQSERGKELQDTLTGAAVGAGTGLVLQGLSKGLGKLGRGLQNTEKGFLRPDEATQALAEQYGVDLPMSAKYQNPVVKQGEAIAQKGIFGNKVRDKVTGAFGKVDELSKGIKEANISGAYDPAETGNLVKEGFKQYVEGFQNTAENLYDAIPNLDNVPADTSNTIGFLKKVVSAKEKAKVPVKDLGYYKSALDALKGDQQGNLFGIKGTSAESLRETLKAVGAKIKDNADPIAKADLGSLKGLYEAINKDIEQSLSKNAPEALAKIQKAGNFYGGNIEKINSQIGRNIQNQNPESILEKVVRPNSETNIKLLKEVVGEEGTTAIQESFMKKVLRESLDSSGEYIDPNKLRRVMDKYGEQTAEQLLDPVQLNKLRTIQNKLDQLATLRKSLSASQKVAEGSQTAYLGKVIGGGLLFFNPSYLLPYILGDYSLAKAFSGSSLVPQELSRLGSSLSKGINPSIQTGITKGVSSVFSSAQGNRKPTFKRNVEFKGLQQESKNGY